MVEPKKKEIQSSFIHSCVA